MTPDAGHDPLAGRKVLILVSEDWYFCSHRLPVGKALRQAGADVVVVTRIRDHAAPIRAAGLRLRPTQLDRSGVNPLHDRATIAELLRIYREERPDIVHHVALKPTLYGAYCAWRTGVPIVINALGGMGFLFMARSSRARLLRGVVRKLLGLLLNRPNSRTILQNQDDVNLLVEKVGVIPGNLIMIRGSGVDTEKFKPTPPPGGTPVAVCVSRMLHDKGIGELVEAARLLNRKGVGIRVRLVGSTDDNPASIDDAILADWAAEGAVEVAGPSTDIPGEYARAHIAVLPSYREGLPKSLLEAAAAGRPMVATDVPGCREICRDGETGLLVPARSVEPLAAALEKLAADPALRERLGARARAIAVAEFAEEIVVRQTLDLYRNLLAGVPNRTR
ncbi:MAG: glycosyltransferase [Alphaproteobacteria bacterium]|nr:glycosyltransferase [Alphaproteobacteria bacterium]